MAVPKQRTSKSKKNKRRSHDAVKPTNQSGCPDCGAPRLSHRVCPNCGKYRGRTIIETDED